jgi:uncharacterized membrane protein
LGDIINPFFKKSEVILGRSPKQTLVVLANEYFKVFFTNNRALILLKLEYFFLSMLAICDEMKIFSIVPSFLNIFCFGTMCPFGLFTSSSCITTREPRKYM